MKAITVSGLVLILAVPAFGQTGIVVKSFHGNGVLTWDGALLNSTCAVQWASSLTEAGRTNWHHLTNVVVRYPHMTTDVPMYYRLFGSPETNTLNMGLVASYPFDGNAQDESGYGHHGTVSGATLTADRLGNTNSAYSFDGINDYIEGAGDISGDAEFSFCVWAKVRFRGDNVDQVLVGDRNGWITVWNISTLRLVVCEDRAGGQSGTTYVYDIPFPRPDDTWVHLAFIAYSDNTGRLFVDGGQADLGSRLKDTGQVSYALPFVSIANLHQPPNQYPSFYYMSGCLDDIRIYNRALTPDEVQAIYLAPPAP